MPLDILNPMAYKKDDDNDKNKNKNSRNTDQPDYKGDGLSFISEEKTENFSAAAVTVKHLKLKTMRN